MFLDTFIWILLFSIVISLDSSQILSTIETSTDSEFAKTLDDQDLIVETLNGKLRGRYFEGIRSESVIGFLGVPYAQPPIGQLRFRGPNPVMNWSGIRNATEFGSICWQPGEQNIYDGVLHRNRSTLRKLKMDHYEMNEDCLTLNIYVAKHLLMSLDERRRVPVLFYIHGGSYYMGAGRLYPGQILSSAESIIVVTFNFRLGPLGFLSTGDESAVGNWGLLDQTQALHWIYSNIHAFGGRNDAITIVGNSAGGASAMFHLVSPMSKGKFGGLTVQSGCSAAPWAIQHFPKKHAFDLGSKLGCSSMSTLALIKCLQSFPPNIILENANLEDGLSLAYAAVIDGPYGGSFLPKHPDELILSNQFHQVPVLAGFTKDEVTIWFTKWGKSAPIKHLKDFLHHDVLSLIRHIPILTEANHAAAFHAVKVQYLYRYGILENNTFGKTSAVSDFISDVGLKAPCIQEMNLLSHHNRFPLYLYEFSYYSVDDVRMNRQEWIGAYHESELQFIFGEAYLNYSNHLRSYDDKKMSDLMMSLWANFIRHGTPNPTGGDRTFKLRWANYTEANQDYASIGLKSHMQKHFYMDRMLFWNFFFPIFRDYEFRIDSNPPNCTSWEYLAMNWVIWVLISFLMILFVLVTSIGLFKLRSRCNNKSNYSHESPGVAECLDDVHCSNSNAETCLHPTSCQSE